MTMAAGKSDDADARFQALIEWAPDALVLVDQKGRILVVNAQTERLFGFARTELLGQPVEILIPERFRGRHQEHRRGYHADPRVRPMGAGMILHGRRKDGSEFPVEISLSPLETPEGRMVMSAIRDITRQKSLEDELRRKNEELEVQRRRAEQANRLKSEFLANMSHELRTPLNGIIGFAELMHDGKVGRVSSEQQEYLGDILTSGRHLLKLINDVLDLSKVETGTLEFRPEPVEVHRVVGEVRDLLRTLAARKRIGIEAEIDPLVARVVTDPSRLKQILYNYLSNALKFTPDEGRVTIRIRSESLEDFRLEVEDTGPGIPEEDLSRLFAEFEQLDAGTAKRHQGTGLGLALTKRIAEAQGGRVGVQSAPGRGSLFFAVLPRTAGAGPGPRAEGQPTARRRSTVPVPGLPRPILVVDDDPRDLKLAERALRQHGYVVVSRSDVEGGLQVAAEDPPSAVVLDLRIPELDGFEFLRRFRSGAAGRGTPVIVWTARELTREERGRLEASAQAIVLKSEGVGALAEALGSHVSPASAPAGEDLRHGG